MKVKLFYEKSVHENAAYYYEKAKESREKMAGVEKAIQETRMKMEAAGKAAREEPRAKRQKEWFEKFHSCFTSGGKLVMGGRSAQQNDQLVSRHMEDNDLFLHADIQGASAVVLRNGADASEAELAEAAQFAACFSKAWANANAAVDVYAVRKEQLTKHISGGFIPTGSFGILGERKWFRSVRLELRIGLGEKGLAIVPSSSATRLRKELALVPSRSGKAKGAMAKSLAKRYGVHPDELLEILPNGKSRTAER